MEETQTQVKTPTKTIPVTLTGDGLPFVLKFIGWIYFLISLIGGIVIWTDPDSEGSTMAGLGVVGVFSSFIVLMICLSLAKIFEQNAFIIKNMQPKGE